MSISVTSPLFFKRTSHLTITLLTVFWNNYSEICNWLYYCVIIAAYSMHWQPSKLLQRLANGNIPMNQWTKYVPAKLWKDSTGPCSLLDVFFFLFRCFDWLTCYRDSSTFNNRCIHQDTLSLIKLSQGVYFVWQNWWLFINWLTIHLPTWIKK